MIWSVTLFLVTATAIGCVLGLNYLRGIRKPALIAAHLLIGAAALEQVAMLLRGAPNGEPWPGESLAKTAGLLLAIGMALGFATPLLRHSRQAMNTVLISHISAAAAGFVVYLAWVARM